jgi:endonuclease/exonuclease/phosphatase family metal-dependent hydrolase
MRGRSTAAAVALLVGAGGLTAGLGAATPNPGAKPVGLPIIDGTPLCGVARPGAGTEASATHGPRPGNAVRIASFNILHSQGDQRNLLGERIPLIVDALVDSDADAAGLQEVTGRFPTGGAGADGEYVAAQVAKGLAARFGERWEWCWFASNPHFPLEPDLAAGGGGLPLSDVMAQVNPGNPGFREGLAIVSRYDIVRVRERRLLPRSYEAPFCDLAAAVANPLGCPAESVFDSRQLLWAEIAGPSGRFDLFTTHIAHELTPASPYTKLLQVKQILHTIDHWADPATPTFLVGDFNSVEGGGGEPTDRHAAVVAAGFTDTFRAFTAAPGSTGGQEIVTADPSPTADGRIDYVFARSSCGVAVHDSEVFADTPTLRSDGSWLWPSDHLAIVSEVGCAAD